MGHGSIARVSMTNSFLDIVKKNTDRKKMAEGFRNDMDQIKNNLRPATSLDHSYGQPLASLREKDEGNEDAWDVHNINLNSIPISPMFEPRSSLTSPSDTPRDLNFRRWFKRNVLNAHIHT